MRAEHTTFLHFLTSFHSTMSLIIKKLIVFGCTINHLSLWVLIKTKREREIEWQWCEKEGTDEEDTNKAYTMMMTKLCEDDN